MKCDKCGYSDNGSGDWAHVCGPVEVKPVAEQGLVFRLRKRAEIRRQIQSRKSVIEGKPDRIADLLEEAADEIERLQGNAINLDSLG
jgi:hypothetical protein